MNQEKVVISEQWIGQDGKTYRSFRRWIGYGWTQSFLQNWDGALNQWVTLY